VLDTCGTGGDGAASVNVSTASAIVASAAGAIVAKHGNRSASGVSGSSDVLDRLGVAIDPGPEILARCLDELGIAFLFAPSFHPALRHAAAVRKQLPFRTLFNLVGPLANPSRPEFQLVGVPDHRLAELMASALARLGVARAAVVTGPEGLDEVGLSGPTRVLWVEGGRVEPRTWLPEEFGLPPVRAEELRVSDPSDSADRIRRTLDGEVGPARHVILANAAAALIVSGLASGPAEGVGKAAEALDSGRARSLLDRWARLSQGKG
jgi:anthranilate phosphoribosyltransferase